MIDDPLISAFPLLLTLCSLATFYSLWVLSILRFHVHGTVTNVFVKGLVYCLNENISQVNSCWSKYFAVNTNETPVIICSTVSLPIQPLRVLRLFHNLATMNNVAKNKGGIPMFLGRLFWFCIMGYTHV